jgi:dolichol-phosphate mannosyltransferase
MEPEAVHAGTSVIVPTRNEAGNVAPVVERLEAVIAHLPITHVPVEIIFVDDSDDDTPEVIRGIRSNVVVRLLHRPPEERSGGLSGAVVAGMRVASAPWVCVMDGDLQHPPEVLAEMVEEAIASESDMVVASRFCDGGDIGSFSRIRMALSSVCSGAANVLFRNRLRNVSDPLSGFFLVRRGALDLDALQPRGFKILLEILIRTRRLRVSEVPFQFGERYAGETKASLAEGARYFSQLASLRLSELSTRFGRFGVVGATGLAVNMLLIAGFADVVGLYYVAAAILATQGSTLWNLCLTELWVFSDRQHQRTALRRAAMFFLVNNAALPFRVGILFLMTTGLGVHYLVSNFVSLISLTVLRFAVADLWIWAKAKEVEAGHSYDIHGIVTIASEVRLPELERFRVSELPGEPDIDVRIGIVKVARRRFALAQNGASRNCRSRNGHQNGASQNGHAHAIRYVEGLGRLGFGVEITEKPDGRIAVTAAPLLRRSPHVLYTNVVEPILRWTFAGRGYALVHAACFADGERAFLITARTDTGKTTTTLKTLDHHPYSFVSDDLTIVCPDGRVLTYPKPLTISRHTVQAVRTPLLSRRERIGLVFQSRLHSRNGRRFAMLIAKLRIPAATLNAVVQSLVPPPKYHIERLIPTAQIAPEATIEGLVVIQRGGLGDSPLERSEALEILLANCEDAYGFPPYGEIEGFLHSRNGHDLKATEREIIERALAGVRATVLRSETLDWWERMPLVINAGNGIGTTGNGNSRRPALIAGAQQRALLGARSALERSRRCSQTGLSYPECCCPDCHQLLCGKRSPAAGEASQQAFVEVS